MITNVLQYLENSAELYPDKTALADETSAVTYEEYIQKSKIIGTYIAKKVMGYNQPVAVFIERNIMPILTFMGCVYSGNFYVPIDATMPEERIALILDTLKPVLRIDARGMAKKGEIKCDIMVEDILSENDIDEALLKNIRNNAIDIDPLYAIFTSGSTGVPKGVLVSHRSVIDLAEQFRETFSFGSGQVFGNQAPFDFDVSVKDIYSAMLNGATLEVIPKKLFMLPVKLIEYINDRKIDTLIWAVSALRIVSDFKTLDKIEVNQMKYIMFSGECMPVKSLNYWRNHVPTARYINLYGPTEITCNCTYAEIVENYPEDKALPIGKPFKNTRIFLIDEKGEHVKSQDCIGEICVGGTCLALGYWNEEQRTKEAFTQNPFITAYESKIYRTGDLGYYDKNGDLVFASRKDFQIKHMGHRIELGEIEVALNASELLDVACCIYDKKNEKIACFYQAGNDVTKEIVAELSKKLPKYMWPNKFFQRDVLPLNKNGKIDRVLLAKELENME